MNTPKKRPTKLRGKDGRLINIGKPVLVQLTEDSPLLVGKLVKVYANYGWSAQPRASGEGTNGRVELTEGRWMQVSGIKMVQLPEQLVTATKEELALFWALQTS